MKKTFLILSILSFQVLAGQSDYETRFSELVKAMSDDDFEVRATACEELSSFPGQFAARLLKMSQTSALESGLWLKQASRDIFLKKILPNDERYKRLFGIVGVELNPESNNYNGYHENRNGGGNGPDPFGYRVTITFPMTDADKVFKKWDLIIKVDGKPASDFFGHGEHIEFGFFKPGDIHEFEIWRYKNLDKIYERGWLKEDEDEHDVIIVKTKVDTKEPWHVNLEKLKWLKMRAWEEFQMVQNGEPGLQKQTTSTVP